jgi:hypothetical protein
MKVISKENLPYWLGAVILLFFICFFLLYISELQIPTVFSSSGIVAIISAIIGVVLTVTVTSVLLSQQSKTQKELLEHQSDKEVQKDKGMKMYEQKIKVYSEFTEKMWEMLEDDKVTDDELRKLRSTCFQRLVFYLNEEQIKGISEHIKKIDPNEEDTLSDDEIRGAIAGITHVLQKGLDSNGDIKGGLLQGLFNSFKVRRLDPPEEQTKEDEIETSTQEGIEKNNITYWHFNMWGNEQIDAFKRDHWVLSLIEYDEDWRTDMLKQVKPNDVLFLFKRGGAGYIGAFRALDKKILENGKCDTKDIAQYDIYKAFDDEATLCSNIIVKPIAYNYKGIGCRVVRRRTIERMNSQEDVNYLLNGFNGDIDAEILTDKNERENRLEGKGKFEDGKEVPVEGSYLSEILKQRQTS